MLRLILALALAAAAALPAAAQSTAINGSIEGVVTDESGAVLPGVTVTVANLDTGDSRVVVTNENASTARRCCRWADTASRLNCRAPRSWSRPASTFWPARPR